MKNLSIDDLMSEIWAAGRNCDREKYDDATEELSRRFAALQDGLMKKHEKPKISDLCIVERGLVRHNGVCV